MDVDHSLVLAAITRIERRQLKRGGRRNWVLFSSVQQELVASHAMLTDHHARDAIRAAVAAGVLKAQRTRGGAQWVRVVPEEPKQRSLFG